eukprot:237523_1
MNCSLVWLTLIQCLYCSITGIRAQQNIIYITKNGTDQNGCVLSLDEACGTLLFASHLVNNSTFSNISIVVYDGQNANEMVKYNETVNPCLPNMFLIEHAQFIEITFNEVYITSMKDWHPCDIKLGAQYMFHIMYANSGSATLRVNNLIINNLLLSWLVNRGFIYSQGANIICHNCIFRNISIQPFDHFRQSIPLFGISGIHSDYLPTLLINNSSVVNCNFDGNFISGNNYEIK